MEDCKCSMEGKIERLISNFESHIASNHRFVKRIEDLLYQHQTAIYGNGKKGINERIALIEQTEGKREKTYFLVVAVMLAFVGDVFFRLFSSIKG